MARYYLGVSSATAQPVDVLYPLLRTPTLSRWLFPCRMPVADTPGTYKTFAAADDVILSERLPNREVPADESLAYHFLLCADNGIRFTATIDNTSKLSVPNTLGLEIPSELILGGSMSWQHFRAMLNEIAPLFHVSNAKLFDLDIRKHLGRIDYFYGPQNVRYQALLGWISYFGSELVVHVGAEKFDNLRTCFVKESLAEGVFIVLQEKPFQASEEVDRAREAQAVDELGLRMLMKRPRRSG